MVETCLVLSELDGVAPMVVVAVLNICQVSYYFLAASELVTFRNFGMVISRLGDMQETIHLAAF